MKILRDFILPIVVALAIYGLLSLTIDSFKVYGVSMLPTIQPDEYIIVNKTAYSIHEPQRGDIIVFHSPREPKDLIKRIIGLPGDTIEIRNRGVFVNGKVLSEPYTAERPNYELLPSQVPPDEYFVLGDNRNHSADSRVGWTLPRQNIIGKAWITYWPPRLWGTIKHQTIVARIKSTVLSEQLGLLTTPCQTK